MASVQALLETKDNHLPERVRITEINKFAKIVKGLWN
jgi:hypothetical protein